MSIYSVKYKFCFIHIEKNAGTSIRDALSKSLKIKHFKSRFYFGPMRGRGGQTARDYISALGKEKYEDFFSFAIVRNPYARLVSWYKYDSFGFDNFEDWLKYFFENVEGKQTDYLRDFSGNIAVDFIGRLENLQSDFDTITRRIGIDPIILERKNVSTKKVSYREFYSTKLRDIVEYELKEELDMFDYKF